MEKDHGIGLVIILGIVGVGLFGGTKNANLNNTINSVNQSTVQTQQQSTGYKESQAQEDLKAFIKSEESTKSLSPYNGIVTISWVNKSTDPSQEYVTLKVSGSSSQSINVTGWQLRSVNNGSTVNIPKGTYLYFTGMVNSEDPISLTGGDTLYLVTGVSPIGVNFKVNKCSGYFTQFQNFVPYINNICPYPRNEDLSSIPKTANNDACINYIESFSACRIATDPLPISWSYECTKFIKEKISYASCVDTHKNDTDFRQPEWRVYLGRSTNIWKQERDAVILYDNNGKVVDSVRY